MTLSLLALLLTFDLEDGMTPEDSNVALDYEGLQQGNELLDKSRLSHEGQYNLPEGKGWTKVLHNTVCCMNTVAASYGFVKVIS